MPSGFHELDQLTTGFQNGDLVIIAGRPGMGKTSFALNIMRNAAIDNKKKIGFFFLFPTKSFEVNPSFFEGDDPEAMLVSLASTPFKSQYNPARIRQCNWPCD